MERAALRPGPNATGKRVAARSPTPYRDAPAAARAAKSPTPQREVFLADDAPRSRVSLRPQAAVQRYSQDDPASKIHAPWKTSTSKVKILKSKWIKQRSRKGRKREALSRE